MAYVAASKLLTGLRFESLPEGWTPVDAVALIKCLDEEGRPTWALRTTRTINDEEVLGALTIRTEMQRVALLQEYMYGGQDDGDD